MKAVVLLGLCALGCQPALKKSPYSIINGDPRASEPVHRSTTEWVTAQAWVSRARADLPQRPYVERVRLSVTDPRTNKQIQVRGAVAVNPDRAARLVLIGPGGGTALDAWVTPDRYRVEIPSIHLTRRGGRVLSDDPRATLGLPVGFLRWWFLAPLGGHLIDSTSVRSDDETIGRVYRFYDGDANVELVAQEQHFLAIRRSHGAIEGVDWHSAKLAPTSGTAAVYENPELGLKVDVMIEEVMPNEPEPAAFLDPDLEAAQ